MHERHTRARFLIQFERPGKDAGVAAALDALRETGVEIDPAYGPFLIDPHRGRYVVRGYATPEARDRAARLEGVRFFADARVEPTAENRE
jgi:hypothetical protein